MARILALAMEPSDAFVGVLRLKAVVEANRWPPDLSKSFHAAIEAEFRRVEDTVRTVGLCYADLEETGVAEINRTPQSRFDDIDGALHLCACAVTVALDLDHLRVAFDHGDRVARESAADLANSLRSVLWYLVHTELFMCTRITLAGREILPERALEFTEGYLSAAWNDVPPAPPPAPALPPDDLPPETNTGRHGPIPRHGSDAPAADGSRAVHLADDLHGEAPTFPPRPGSIVPEVTVPALGPFAAFSQDARYFLFQADIREKDWPVQRATLLAARRTVLRRLHADTAGAHTADMYASAERGAGEVLSFLAAQEATSPLPTRSEPGATVQIRAEDLLSNDARYFLDEAGLAWPGDAAHLDAARAALAKVATGDPARTDRLERAYHELRRMAAR